MLSRGRRAALTFPFLASVCLALCGFGAPAEGSYGVWRGGGGPHLVTLDPEGNRTSTTTPKGQTTTTTYDELGKLTKVTQPAVLVHASGGGAPTLQTPVTTYGYDENRNRTLQTDANGHVVAMEYDELNRLKKTIQDPGGLNLVTETTRFDENGNPEIVKDPKGQTTTSSFDELNRLKTKTYAFAASDPERPWRHTTAVAFTYDENGNLLRQDETVASGTDPPAYTASIVRTYDALDRLKSERTPLPEGGEKALTHTYWKNGLRKTTNDPESGLTSYAYDGQNRLQTVTTGLGTATYTYFGDDLLHTLTEPDGSVATQDYDKADRLLSVAHTKGANALASYAYTYDANGNRLTQVETNGAAPETTGYTYDDLDRLATITYPDKKLAYGYDAVGNRRRETEKTLDDAVVSDKDAVFDALNRLETVTDLAKPEADPARTVGFTWDSNGNQRTKTENAVTTTYDYDVRDKLIEVGQGASILVRYQYDAEGRLLKKIGEDGIRQYVYDETSRLAEYDQAGSRVARFSYGSDRLISMEHGNEGARFYHLDGLRSVTALTDASGTVTARLRLDAWGQFREPADLSSSANRFAFTGHIFEAEIQLYSAKARYFDPKLGRFLTQDSFLGRIDRPPSLHRYTYASDNPSTRIDLTGHDDADANALAKAMSKSAAGWMASDHRPAYQKSWGRNFTEALYVEVPLRAMPGQAKMLQGMARQDAGEFAAGATEAVAVAATPLMVKEGGGALLDRLPALARVLRKDVGEWASSTLGKGGEVLRSVAARAKGLFGEPPAGGNSLVPAKGSLEPLPPQASGQVIEMVSNAEGTYVASFEAEASGLAAGPQPRAALESPSTARLPQDVSVNPRAPQARPLNRRIGSSPAQHAQLQADIAAAQARGARNIRVNQQQLDAAGNRVGTGRPDLQYTLEGKRVHIEYDTPSSGRGVPHANRLLANDPAAAVETKTIE